MTTTMAGADDQAWIEWSSAQHRQRLHHAWLLAGPEGGGNSGFAWRAAGDLVAPFSNGPHHHPDIIHLRREPKDATEARKAEEGKPFELARNITVAQIRTVQRKLTTRPTLGMYRAVIIDKADDLEPGAANALLKSLEEPSAGTVFLLIAAQSARLLPTIRSRCRLLRFRPPDDGGAVSEHGHGQLAKAIDALLEPSGDKSALVHAFCLALGNRPSRSDLQTALQLSQARVTGGLALVDGDRLARIDLCHGELGRLERELATYNYDPDLLAVRIGTLLSGVATPIDARDG